MIYFHFFPTPLFPFFFHTPFSFFFHAPRFRSYLFLFSCASFTPFSHLFLFLVSLHMYLLHISLIGFICIYWPPLYLVSIVFLFELQFSPANVHIAQRIWYGNFYWEQKYLSHKDRCWICILASMNPGAPKQEGTKGPLFLGSWWKRNKLRNNMRTKICLFLNLRGLLSCQEVRNSVL